MAKRKNYYVVKVGRVPGIYTNWEECKQQIDRYPRAVYKGFEAKFAAEDYWNDTEYPLPNDEDDSFTRYLDPDRAIAYVDGSYEDALKRYSYGVVLLLGGKVLQQSPESSLVTFADGQELHLSESGNDETLLPMRNVAGEILGAQKAMSYCVENDIKTLTLHYDYEGVEKWLTGEWKANKPGTQAYKLFYDDIKNKLKVHFMKVKAHTGVEYNELADKLAKQALLIK